MVLLLQSRTPDISGGDTDNEEEEEDPEQLAGFIEGTSRGIVKGNIMVNYFRIGSSIFLAIVLMFLFVLTQFLASLNDFFIPILYVLGYTQTTTTIPSSKIRTKNLLLFQSNSGRIARLLQRHARARVERLGGGEQERHHNRRG